jgi:hypothetical protein
VADYPTEQDMRDIEAYAAEHPHYERSALEDVVPYLLAGMRRRDQRIAALEQERDAAIEDTRDYMALVEERDRLRAALEAVEWVVASEHCPWCGAWELDGHGHAPDCQRRAALAARQTPATCAEVEPPPDDYDPTPSD